MHKEPPSYLVMPVKIIVQSAWESFRCQSGKLILIGQWLSTMLWDMVGV